MNRHCVDSRVWLPALLAALLFAGRATPPPRPARDSVAHSTTLPPVHGLPPASGERWYDLDADASALRFLVADSGGSAVYELAVARGELRLAMQPSGPPSGSLELHFDPASLRRVGEPQVHETSPNRDANHGDLVLRAELTTCTTDALAGITNTQWRAELPFTGTKPQTLQLWLCTLPGRPLRLQGHQALSGTLELPTGSWFESLRRRDVTLGLDLVWKRRSAR